MNHPFAAQALIALIAIIVGCVLGGALCWFVAHLVYGYCVLGWKCPDLGAIGGTIYFDERRGQCFCGVFFVTTFSFMSMIFAYLAGQTDPELVSVFGFARLQSTDALTYLVVGLSGYVVVADVLADDDAGVADDSLTGTKDYVAFEVGEVDDDAAGSAYDWVNACGDAGALAQGAIYPIVFVKFVACFVLYKRVGARAGFQRFCERCFAQGRALEERQALATSTSIRPRSRVEVSPETRIPRRWTRRPTPGSGSSWASASSCIRRCRSWACC